MMVDAGVRACGLEEQVRVDIQVWLPAPGERVPVVDRVVGGAVQRDLLVLEYVPTHLRIRDQFLVTQ